MQHASLTKSKRTVAYATLFLIVVLLATLSATTHRVEAATTQLAYWQLDEVSGATFSNTISPGTLDAACTNCPTPTGGQVNGGQLFDGTANALNVAANTSLDFTAVSSFTAELWARASAPDCVSNATLIGRGDPTSGPAWSLGCDPTTGQARFHISDGSNSVTVTSSRVLAADTWHHLVATWDGATATATLYFDRTDVQSVTAVALSGNLAPTTADLNIGHQNNSQFFAGTLDEIALYNSVLPTTEIGEHYYFPQAYGTTCAAPIAIMPLGDSITVGVYGSQYIDPVTLLQGDPRTAAEIGGYRQPLYLSLRNNNHDIDFVGSQLHGADLVPQFDINHESVSGRTALQVANDIYGQLDVNPADVVLLHIGTNNITTSTTDVQSILNEIDRWESDNGRSITVVLAQIINKVPTEAIFTNFNANLLAMANTRIANGDKIIIVDMETGAGLTYSLFSAGGDFADRLHPYDNGYAKMANTWLGVLNTFMPTCNVTPLISSVADTGVQVNTPYSYQMTASGSPTISFQLESPPAGMAITDGLISWTPTLTGSYPITATAVNPYGSDTQYFTITVTDTVTAVAPTITTTPVTAATVGAAYSYDVDASGDAPITYSLSVTPTGMTIDPGTGLISWTPTAVGSANVTVVATNSAGSDSQPFTITVTAATALSCPLPTGLIAYYPLNDASGSSFLDGTGSGNTAVCTSGNCPVPATGLIGSGQQFTAANATTVNAANPTNFNFASTDSFSFSLWVNTTQSCAGNKVFLARRDAQFWLGCNAAGNVNLSLQSDGQGTSTNLTGGSAINDGNWHHLAAVLQPGTPNDTVTVYVDGTAVATQTAVNFDSFTNATQPLTLGYYNVSPWYYFEGQMDDVAIFRRALTPTDVQAIFNNGILAGASLEYTTAWTGASSNAWETAANWSSGVPTSSDNVAILSGTAQLNGNAAVACLHVANGATANLGTDNTLTVEDSLTSDGTLVQTRTAVSGSSPIPFLAITDSGGTNTRYLGVDITPNSDLGSVTVAIREANAATNDFCTTTGASSPTYADRCVTITAQNAPATSSTVRLYAHTDDLNGVTTPNLAVYRGNGGSVWTELTARVTGSVGSYAYAEGSTASFSPFLLGQTTQAPTAVSLAAIRASSPMPQAAPVTLLLLTLVTLAAIWRRRR